MLETIFTWCSAIAMLGWAGLALAPGVAVLRELVIRVFIPAAIAVVYLYLMIDTRAADGAGFGSLAEVKALFSVDALLVAGWIHYLAFDLFIGTWEVADSRREGIHHLLVIPCLFATLMAGPAGLLLYFVLKYAHRWISGKDGHDQPA